VDAEEIRALRMLCEQQREEAETVKEMLQSTCDELDAAVGSLSKRLQRAASPSRGGGGGGGGATLQPPVSPSRKAGAPGAGYSKRLATVGKNGGK
jgi:hypothetical protein